jgi:hypothetical protein
MVNVGYFMTIWNILGPFTIIIVVCYSLWSFVIFFPMLNVRTKKNLATLLSWHAFSQRVWCE